MKHVLKSTLLIAVLTTTAALATQKKYEYPYEHQNNWQHAYTALPYTGLPQNHLARSLPHDMALEERALLHYLSGTGAKVIHEHSRLQIVMPIEASFDTDSTQINNQLQTILDGVATLLKKYPFTVAEIGAHADSRGSIEYNQRLTERRAEAAKQYLEKQGVPAERMIPVGHGELEPIASNSTPAGMQANRRLVVDVYSVKPRKF